MDSFKQKAYTLEIKRITGISNIEIVEDRNIVQGRIVNDYFFKFPFEGKVFFANFVCWNDDEKNFYTGAKKAILDCIDKYHSYTVKDEELVNFLQRQIQFKLCFDNKKRTQYKLLDVASFSRNLCELDIVEVFLENIETSDLNHYIR